MITWFLVGWTVWNIIGLISAFGSILFWGFMWLLWVMAPANKCDHLCNGPWSTPPPLPPRINGQTDLPRFFGPIISREMTAGLFAQLSAASL